MKTFILVLLAFLLFAGNSFAGDFPADIQKNNDKENAKTNQSGFKTSPRLSYKSQQPNEKDNAFGNMKPMLNQMLGNGQNGTPGAVMPNGGTYSF